VLTLQRVLDLDSHYSIQEFGRYSSSGGQNPGHGNTTGFYLPSVRGNRLQRWQENLSFHVSLCSGYHGRPITHCKQKNRVIIHAQYLWYHTGKEPVGLSLAKYKATSSSGVDHYRKFRVRVPVQAAICLHRSELYEDIKNLYYSSSVKRHALWGTDVICCGHREYASRHWPRP